MKDQTPVPCNLSDAPLAYNKPSKAVFMDQKINIDGCSFCLGRAVIVGATSLSRETERDRALEERVKASVQSKLAASINARQANVLKNILIE
mmetsp:Transcript_9359/g.12238  ORF Transcript_9359/g.12238 Transcript_9359/m.12238 type:complete len:92 (-) Transcript_9359:118-393(-)